MASYWLETLGCPKNRVDSDKLAGVLALEGYELAEEAGGADLVVVNTCAFIEPAREESVAVVLEMASAKKAGARLVVTGCLAERYGTELAEAMPEVDQVAGFGVAFWDGVAGPKPAGPKAAGPEAAGPEAAGQKPAGGAPVTFGRSNAPAGTRRPHAGLGPSAEVRQPEVGQAVSDVAAEAPRRSESSFDLLELARPPAGAPWAYVKIAEGCDRHCGFCAIPEFRGPQRSRTREAILEEVERLGAEEVVLVAQDPVSWGREARGTGGCRAGGLAGLVREVRQRVERVRLLYLYPSGLNDELIEVLGSGGCPYFDLSLQHVSRPLLRRMRRYGDGERFLERISFVRRHFPDAALRSSFIIGYPGETEEDHDALLCFLKEAELDWAGFFAFSPEEGTYAASQAGQVPSGLVAERARECSELQDTITAAHRSALVGTKCRALIDAPGEARSHREAPEIDGVIGVPLDLVPGTWAELEITGSLGPDLVGEPVVAL
ncbi:MAG: MiaB/RimO family radical SAM methylthiotransferase [Acidimicrobiales bacterium]